MKRARARLSKITSPRVRTSDARSNLGILTGRSAQFLPDAECSNGDSEETFQALMTGMPYCPAEYI